MPDVPILIMHEEVAAAQAVIRVKSGLQVSSLVVEEALQAALSRRAAGDPIVNDTRRRLTELQAEVAKYQQLRSEASAQYSAMAERGEIRTTEQHQRLLAMVQALLANVERTQVGQLIDLAVRIRNVVTDQSIWYTEEDEEEDDDGELI